MRDRMLELTQQYHSILVGGVILGCLVLQKPEISDVSGWAAHLALLLDFILPFIGAVFVHIAQRGSVFSTVYSVFLILSPLELMKSSR